MAGLLDIAPLSAVVVIRGASIPVTGIEAAGIAHLLRRFPPLRKLLAQQAVGVEDFLEHGEDLVPAVIAAGVGFAGDAEQEERARRLTLVEQFDILEAIVEISFPAMAGPFVQLRAALENLAVAGQSPSEPGSS